MPGADAWFAPRLRRIALGALVHTRAVAQYSAIRGHTAEASLDGIGTGHPGGNTPMTAEAWKIAAAGVALGSSS